MNRERLARAKSDMLILAPGPINRGVEITADVADGSQSVILDQVTNGLAVRMAVLLLMNMPFTVVDIPFVCVGLKALWLSLLSVG